MIYKIKMTKSNKIYLRYWTITGSPLSFCDERANKELKLIESEFLIFSRSIMLDKPQIL